MCRLGTDDGSEKCARCPRGQSNQRINHAWRSVLLYVGLRNLLALLIANEIQSREGVYFYALRMAAIGGGSPLKIRRFFLGIVVLEEVFFFFPCGDWREPRESRVIPTA